MPATTPTLTPSASSRMTGWRRSAAVRKVPTWATPACSSRSAVCTKPSKPWSSAWLEAVVQASQPIDAIHGAISRRCGEDRVGLQRLARRRERHLLVAEREVGALDQRPHVGEHRVEVVAARRRVASAAALCQTVSCQSRSPPMTSDEPARLGLRLRGRARRPAAAARVRPAEHDARRAAAGAGAGSGNGAPSTAAARAAQVTTPTCARTAGRRMKVTRGCLRD